MQNNIGHKKITSKPLQSLYHETLNHERLAFSKKQNKLNENYVLYLEKLLDLWEKDFKHTKLVFGTTLSTIKSMK